MDEAYLPQILEHYASLRPEGAMQIVPMGTHPVKIYWYFPVTDEAILILFDALSMKELGCERIPAEEAKKHLASARQSPWGVQ
jgi:hypothetical protein